MGYGDFLKLKVDKTTPPASASLQQMAQISSAHPPLNPFAGGSGSNSLSSNSRPASIAPSIMSNRVSRGNALDAVKHQVMVHYLYQQQGNNGWRSNGDNRSEGIVLRLSRDNYLTHPASLSESTLLASLKNLNVQVGSPILSSSFLLTWEQGCNDDPLSSH